MKLIVCGPRTLDDKGLVWNWLAAINGTVSTITSISCGGARGADRFAEEWATCCRKPCAVFEADWETHGGAAGPLRNQQMLEETQPDAVLAFQPVGRETPGTQDMVRRARKANVPVFLVEYHDAS